MYDGYDRLTRTNFADTSYEELGYDVVGNVLTRRNRTGQTLSFTYDPLNRLATKTPSEQGTITHVYDLAGRVLSLTNASGTFSYGYDTAGRNISVTRPDSKVVGYQYDLAGNRTRLTWPDAFYVTYGYDALNRLMESRGNGATLLAL